MAGCLDAAVRLRALLPFGPVEVSGRDQVASWFAAVFGVLSASRLIDGTVGEVGPRLHCPRKALASGMTAIWQRTLAAHRAGQA